MKVLFVATDIMSHGGMPRFQRNIIKQLKNQKDTAVEIISVNDKEKEVNGAGGNKLKFLLKFVWLLIRFKPDQVILGHLGLVRLGKLKFLLPSSFWHVVLYGIEAWVDCKNLRPYYSSINRYWAISNYTKDKFSETNGVSSDKIKIVILITSEDWDPKELNVVYDPFFLSVAKVDVSEGYKGIDKSIEAIHRNEKEMRAFGYTYVIIGSGDDLERHKDMVKNYNLSDIITIKKGISDAELKELYRSTSCSLLPSSGEGFGFIFLEAMAYKKACIGCKNCGSEDLIEHEKTGYLVEPTVEDIWKHMKLLMANSANSKAMGEAGYVKREKGFKGAVAEINLNELLKV